MARSPRIRISKTDRTEYNRLARNARAKLKRIEKNHNLNLSDEIPIPKLTEITTRKAFNEWKENVESFLNPYNQKYQFITNEYGVTISKSELFHLKRRRKLEQMHAQKELEKVKDLPIYHRNEQMVRRGGKREMTVGEYTHFMGADATHDIQVPKDINFGEIRNMRRLKRLIEISKRRSQPNYYKKQQQLMKENFIKGLQESFDSHADELVERLKALTEEEFYHLYIQNIEFEFDDFHYDEQMEFMGNEVFMGYVSKLEKIFERHMKRQKDVDDMMRLF